MRPKLALLASVVALAVATPVAAQMDHSNMPGMSMPGMKMPAPKKPAAKKPVAKRPVAKKAPATKAVPRKPAAKPAAKAKPPAKARPATPAARTPAADPHAGHDMSAMPGMQMPQGSGATPGHDMSSMPGMQMSEGDADAAPAHDMENMPGMQMPPARQAMPQGHDMSSMPGMQMPGGQAMPTGHDMGAMPAAPGAAMIGTNLPAGNAPAPPVPTDFAADRVYTAANMAGSRHHLYTMHGGQNFYQVLGNLAEYQARKGRDGYRWDAEAWYGGDINRLWVKTEGDGDFGRSVGEAQVEALYSRTIGPYFNLQGGVRYDFKPNPSRAYAAFGVEGLAPSFFDVEAFVYLSNKGDVLAEFEGSYDQRITQRLILQPRIDLNFAAQDVRENGIGSGLSSGEVGLRLRYDIRREFAPYVGVSYGRRFGDTARFTRAEGDGARSTSFVLGVRTWF